MFLKSPATQGLTAELDYKHMELLYPTVRQNRWQKNDIHVIYNYTDNWRIVKANSERFDLHIAFTDQICRHCEFWRLA